MHVSGRVLQQNKMRIALKMQAPYVCVFVVRVATQRNLHEPEEVFIFSARRLENGLSPVIISPVTRSDMVIVKSI